MYRHARTEDLTAVVLAIRSNPEPLLAGLRGSRRYPRSMAPDPTASARSSISLGIALWNQASTWAEFETAARRVDELGYDHLFTWDHLYGIVGDPHQPTWEGYPALAALPDVRTRLRRGRVAR